MSDHYIMLGILGITLEILGFVLLLKIPFNQKPTAKEANNWSNKYKISHPGWLTNTRKVVLDERYETSIDVPNRFYWEWTIKHQIPIYLVILGLVFQILQMF